MFDFDFMFGVGNYAGESDLNEVEEEQCAAEPLDNEADQTENISDRTAGIAGQADKTQGAASPTTHEEEKQNGRT